MEDMENKVFFEIISAKKIKWQSGVKVKANCETDEWQREIETITWVKIYSDFKWNEKITFQSRNKDILNWNEIQRRNIRYTKIE